MPFERPEEAAARREAKSARARELAQIRAELDRSVEERVLLQLSLEFVRGFEELGALMRVSSRAAQEIAARSGFPAACSPTGDRVRLWHRRAVIEWLLAQELARD